MQLPLLNTQAIEPPIWREDGSLEVRSIFSTIQGEGPFAGRPSIFVRLAGCNLKCPACDTEYTSFRMLHSPSALLNAVKAVRQDKRIDLIVITGGEPFRQNIVPFVNKAANHDWDVQIETNGAVFPDYGKLVDMSRVTVVCSPKTPRVSPNIRKRYVYWKYVVQAGNIDPNDGLPLTTLGNSWGVARPNNMGKSVRYRIYVQPLDEQDPIKNKANEQAAIDSCMKFGYRLSYQMHKALGLE